jgi:hypothetical protein
MPLMKSGFEVPWYNCVPSGTVARKNDIPLWFRLPPHWRIEEWIALKIWFALQTVASLELARLGLMSAKIENKEMGALRCILTASERCTLLPTSETKQISRWTRSRRNRSRKKHQMNEDFTYACVYAALRWQISRDVLSSFTYAASGECDSERCSNRLRVSHNLIDKIFGTHWLMRPGGGSVSGFYVFSFRILMVQDGVRSVSHCD